MSGRTAIAAVGMLVASLAPASALDDDATLEGLTGVVVKILKFDTTASDIGLSEAEVQRDLELRLRTNRVQVLAGTTTDCAPTCGLLLLSVAVMSLGTDLPLYSFCVDPQLWDAVTIRRSSVYTVAATWDSAGKFGTVARSSASDFIREAVRDMGDEFSNDFLAANPIGQE